MSLQQPAHLGELGEHERAVAGRYDLFQHLGQPRELAGACVDGKRTIVLSRSVQDPVDGEQRGLELAKICHLEGPL